MAVSSARSSRVRPRDVRRVGADRVGDPRRVGVLDTRRVDAESQSTEGRGQPDERSREQRRTAAVDGRHRDRLAGEVGERGRDRLLERVVRRRGRCRSASRSRHRSRASRRACPSSSSRPAPAPRRRGSSPHGRRRRAGSPAVSEGRPRSGRRTRGSGVLPRRGTALPSGTRTPARAARAGGRARAAPCRAPGRACCTSAAAPARRRPRPPRPPSVGGQRDHGAVVVTLDEAVADDLGDGDGVHRTARSRTKRGVGAGTRPQ